MKKLFAFRLLLPTAAGFFSPTTAFPAVGHKISPFPWIEILSKPPAFRLKEFMP
ncbi:MAG: hypothetical protein IT219_03210 [Bacteroidales bacterium]|nr:hypothetical protein [Bacteroidales bacterium]